jgi:hypothetical protein
MNPPEEPTPFACFLILLAAFMLCFWIVLAVTSLTRLL